MWCFSTEQVADQVVEEDEKIKEAVSEILNVIYTTTETMVAEGRTEEEIETIIRHRLKTMISHSKGEL